MAEIKCLRVAMIEQGVWDDTLTPELRDHARTCPACAAALTNTERARQALHAVRTMPVPAPPAAAAWAQVRGQVPGAGLPAWTGSLARWALAATALLALVALGVLLAGRDQSRPLTLAQLDTTPVAARPVPPVPLSTHLSADRIEPTPAPDRQHAAGNTFEFHVYNTANWADRVEFTVSDTAANFDNSMATQPGDERLVERRASITVCVTDARAELKRLTAAVAGLGGIIISSQLNQPQGAAGAEALVSVRVPAKQYDTFVNLVHACGDLLAENISAADRGPATGYLQSRLNESDSVISRLRQRQASELDSWERARNGETLRNWEQFRDGIMEHKLATEGAVFNLILRETTLVNIADLGPSAKLWFGLRQAGARAFGLALTVTMYLIIGGGALLPVALFGWFTWRWLRPRLYSW